MSLMNKKTSPQNDQRTATKHNGHHLSDSSNSDRRKRLKMSSPDAEVTDYKECVKQNKEAKNTAVNSSEKLENKADHVIPFKLSVNGCVEPGQ